MYVSAHEALSGPAANISPFELMESRVLLEGEAAALAASLITDQQLESLREMLKRMSQESAAKGLGRNCADRQFHSIIAEATNNQMLQHLIQGLWDAQQDLEHICRAHQAICEPNPEIRLAEHQAIYDALATHNAQAARAAMRIHFARAIEALHAATEEEAVAEVQRHLSRTRERFSSDRMIDSGANRSAP